jgi:predicted PurR-regulated permease PerM
MDEAIRNKLLALIAVLLAIAGLRFSYPVTMPLAVAAMIVAAVWPVKPWLDRRLPSTLSYAGTIVVLLAILLVFLGAVYLSAAQIVEVFTGKWDQFERMLSGLTARAERWGIPIGGQAGYARLVGFGQQILANAYTVLGYVGLISLLVMLGLPEVPALRQKIRTRLSAPDRRELMDAVDETGRKIRQYLGTTTLTSILTGLASALWAFVVGLDLAAVWGLLNFLLNYVPVVGNIIGILPPTLFAVIQYSGWTMPAVVFIGYVVIQITISNVVYPVLQGRSLSLSPLAVVVALTFWSWLWGIAGALIAVPLTVVLVIVCEHFAATRWVAVLLSSPERDARGGGRGPER